MMRFSGRGTAINNLSQKRAVGVRHAHLFCIDDVHDDATLLRVKDARVNERQEMHTFSIWARPDLTYIAHRHID